MAFRCGSETKKWQIEAKPTCHQFGKKINWFKWQKEKGSTWLLLDFLRPKQQLQMRTQVLGYVTLYVLNFPKNKLSL
jgi:hypothetical protein